MPATLLGIPPRVTAVLGAALALGVVCCLPTTASATPSTTRASLTSTGAQGMAGSLDGTISADGRFVVFTSSAALVPQDTNGKPDVYLRDRATGETIRVSAGPGTLSGNDASDQGRITDDGRFVFFHSAATNLLPTPTSGQRIYRFDVATAALTLLPAPPGATTLLHPAPSADGRYVAFRVSDGAGNIHRLDTQTGQIARASETAGGTVHNGSLPLDDTAGPAISADGRWVAFVSSATNLVTPDSGLYRDVFVKDMDTGAVQPVSSATGEANLHSSWPAVSGDGCAIAFFSTASNIVAGDANGGNDVFVRDRCAGSTVIASVNNAGTQTNTILAPVSISADGCRTAFLAKDLLTPAAVTGSAAVMRNVCAGSTSRLDISTAGEVGTGRVTDVAISGGTGRYVVFSSAAPNLVDGDTNTVSDVFVRDLATNTAPVAALEIGVSGMTVTADATASRDPDGHHLTGTIGYGDGTPAVAGLNGVHAYARAGTYSVTATVTDADGVSSSRTVPVTVATGTAPPPSTDPPSTGPGATPADQQPLVLDRLKLSTARFAVVRKGRKPDRRHGATLALRLSAPATLRLAFARARPGRRVKGTCRPGARRGPRCTSYARARTTTRALPAGTSRVAITGRIGATALAPGRYRLTVSARTPDGRTSTSKRFTITIAKAKAGR